jgi:hypothetical protein
MRWESRAAHAAYARVFDSGNDKSGIRLFNVTKAVKPLHPLVSSVILNCDTQYGFGRKLLLIVYFRDLAADARVDRHPEKTIGFADELTDLYLIALLYARLRRLSQMHAHGNNYCLRHIFAYRFIAGQRFTIPVKMETTAECKFWQYLHLPL